MVLHFGDDDFVVFADLLASKGLCDEIDAFGGSAHKDDFSV